MLPDDGYDEDVHRAMQCSGGHLRVDLVAAFRAAVLATTPTMLTAMASDEEERRTA